MERPAGRGAAHPASGLARWTRLTTHQIPSLHQRHGAANWPACSTPTAPVPGVTQGTLRPEIAAIAVPATTDGRNMTGDDFALTAGWGHYGTGDAVMPGQGRTIERDYTPDERAALGDASVLGEKTLDVYLNDRAFWRNVPAAVWDYKLGGYQVLKKWLSYRESDVLGRALTPEEVLYFAEMTRRVGGILRFTAMDSST